MGWRVPGTGWRVPRHWGAGAPARGGGCLARDGGCPGTGGRVPGTGWRVPRHWGAGALALSSGCGHAVRFGMRGDDGAPVCPVARPPTSLAAGDFEMRGADGAAGSQPGNAGARVGGA
eukprot:366079-Chlamydomonas_euryale.AAC.1